MTIRQCLAWATRTLSEAGVPDADYDAQEMLAHVLGEDRLCMRIDSGRELDDSVLSHYESLIGRRAAREPMQYILGTSGTLQWREGDRSRVWCTCPTHPIAQGIPASFELPAEEMYGEYSDPPKPPALVFVSWFAGGEVFRSGCTWTRGYGKIFYFQPGHETDRSYYIPEIRQIIKNAVRWAVPVMRREEISCPHAEVTPEAKWANK